LRRLWVVPLALLEWFAGGLFAVNGPNYDWWAGTLFALALLTLALGVLPPTRLPLAVAGVGLPVALATLVVTTQRFNDSYTGTRAWPDTLAVVFGIAVAAAELALTRRAWPQSHRASA
jgi:hypothetical protein